MNQLSLRVLSLALFVVSACALADCGLQSLFAQSSTLSPPNFPKDQLQKAEELIKDIFKEELEQAKVDKNVGLKLAQTLLEQSKRINEEAHVRFVALTLARDLAARAGDHQTAFQAIAELAKHHKIDSVAMMAEALEIVVANIGDVDRAKGLAAMSFKMANSFFDDDRYDVAVRYGKIAEAAAKKAGDASLLQIIGSRASELLAAQQEAQRLQPFLQKLKTNPNDPQANLEVGKSWCFVRDKWERGLPYLAKGKDAALKEVAQKDLAGPQNPQQQAALADEWRKLGQAAEGTTKWQMLRRAFQWYQRAVFQLEGPTKQNVQDQLDKLVQTLPARYRVTEIETEIRRLTGHTAEVLTVDISPNGLQAISGSADKTLRLWELRSGGAVRTFVGHVGAVFWVTFARDGKHVFSTSEDKTVRMWELGAAKEIKQFRGQTDFINGLAVSPNGKLLAGAGQDRNVYIWDIESGKKLHQLSGHTGAVFRVAFSPEGTTLASASDDQTIRLWDLESGKSTKQFTGHTGQVLALAYSPDGKKLLSGGEDNTIRLWDVATAKEIRSFSGHTSIVGAVAFAPDGSRFISASDDRTLRLWEAETGKQVRQLMGHTDAVYGVAFSPDGRWALSCSLDKTLRLWGERR